MPGTRWTRWTPSRTQRAQCSAIRWVRSTMPSFAAHRAMSLARCALTAHEPEAHAESCSDAEEKRRGHAAEGLQRDGVVLAQAVPLIATAEGSIRA
jgi:hypothetical protein